MTEYIDKAEALKKQYCIRRASLSLVTNDFNKVYARVVDAMDIENIPPADVAPVIHARWIDNGRGGYAHAYFCGNCGWIDGHPIEDRHKYCPNCGAKMDESEDEE